MMSCQKMHVPRYVAVLGAKYLHMEFIEPGCNIAAVFNSWSRFTKDYLPKGNYYQNHISLSDEDTQIFFENMVDINMN